MFKDDNFLLKHPIIITVIILIYISSPVYSSISQWFEHPKKIECSALTNKCSLKEYAYKHNICWVELLRTRRSGHLYYCRLPKYQISEFELLPLSEIKDVVVKNEPSAFQVYLKSDKESEVRIAAFDKYNDATYISSHLKAHIKKWQEDSAVTDSESDNSYTFNWVE